MGYTKIKRHFISILAGIAFSIAGVLSLSTLPSFAGQPISGPDCQAQAEDIRARALANAAESDQFEPFTNICPNLCNAGAEESINGTTFDRKPGQSEGVTVATTIEYADDADPDDDGDVLYAATIFGPVAFFCDVEFVESGNILSDVNSFGSIVVGVGHPSPALPSGQQTSCFIFNQLCTGP